MFMGDFDSAREFARADEKWLMVTVSDSTEFACEVMKRDVWRIPEVKTLIRENFIFLFVKYMIYMGFPYPRILAIIVCIYFRRWSAPPQLLSF